MAGKQAADATTTSWPRLVRPDAASDLHRAATASTGRRLSTRDRIALLAWSDEAARSGIGRVVVERPEPGDDPDVAGEFVLFYERDTEWARWAVAPQQSGFLLWSCADGATIGRYPTLIEALGAVPPTGRTALCG